MRRILVASQKGGVGKTTTAINLGAAAAASGARVLLVDADPLGSIEAALALGEDEERPGVRRAASIPGLDVGAAPDAAAAEDLLAWAEAKGYDLAIVDSQPFAGDSTEALLESGEDVLLVLRAEPLSYRTLPSFLRALRRSATSRGTARLAGVVLTLPPGTAPGGPLEQELRRLLGERLLEPPIPHDPSVAEAVLAGVPVGAVGRPGDAALSYRALAATLGLV